MTSELNIHIKRTSELKKCDTYKTPLVCKFGKFRDQID